MTEPDEPFSPPGPPALPPRRRNADYRWTRDKAIAFLHALRACGSVARAARGLGMSRQSAYRLRARYGANYAAVWDEAVDLWRRLGPPLPRAVAASQGYASAPQSDAAYAQGDAFAPHGDGPRGTR